MSQKPKRSTANKSELLDDLDNLEEALSKLSCKVQKIVKKNGFSKKLKMKTSLELSE